MVGCKIVGVYTPDRLAGVQSVWLVDKDGAVVHAGCVSRKAILSVIWGYFHGCTSTTTFVFWTINN
jgi:hypothetical protein